MPYTDYSVIMEFSENCDDIIHQFFALIDN